MAADSIHTGTSKPLVVMTGATGFIGLHIQRALLDQGFAVLALVRSRSKRNSSLDSRCQILETTLEDPAALVRRLRFAHAVIYCAGAVRGRELSDFEAANVHGVRNVMSALARLDTPPPMLLMSSLAASRPHLSNYARSKFLGEIAVAQFDRVPWCIFRPSAVYGPGDKEMQPVFDWARRGVVPVVGPRDQRVSLLFVSDLVNAILAWLENFKSCNGGVFELHDGQQGGYDWADIAAAAGSARPRLLVIPAALLRAVANVNWRISGWLGYAPMLTPGKTRELQEKAWICDNAAFHAATQWEPEVDLFEGVNRTYSQLSGNVHEAGKVQE